MTKKTPIAPQYGDKVEGLTFTERLARIEGVLAKNNRALDVASAIGRRFLDDGKTLSQPGQRFLRTLEGFMDLRGHSKTTLDGRLAAMQELAPLRLSEDCSATDMDLVLHHGIDAAVAPTAQAPAPSPSAAVSGDPLVMRSADGAVLVGDDAEEARRLGGPTKGGERWSRLRQLAEKHALDLTKASARQMGEAWLFAECAHPHAHGWKSFAEAAFTLQKQNPTISPADVARKVRELRPDLLDMPRGRRQPTMGEKLSFTSKASAEATLHSEVERLASIRHLDAQNPTVRGQLLREVTASNPAIGRAMYYGGDVLDLTEDDDTPRRTPLPTSDNADVVVPFNEAVTAELNERGLEDNYSNRTKVGSLVRKKHPHLAPVYGRGRRS